MIGMSNAVREVRDSLENQRRSCFTQSTEKGLSMQQPNDRVIVFAGSNVEADLVKLHLQEVGIKAQLENENSGTMVPFASASGGAGAVGVSVPIGDEDRAKKLMERHRGS